MFVGLLVQIEREWDLNKSQSNPTEKDGPRAHQFFIILGQQADFIEHSCQGPADWC